MFSRLFGSKKKDDNQDIQLDQTTTQPLISAARAEAEGLGASATSPEQQPRRKDGCAPMSNPIAVEQITNNLTNGLTENSQRKKRFARP